MKVLVVDDSAIVRRMLERKLIEHPRVDAVITARDAYEAREKIANASPHMLILDLEMPGVDGLHLLEKLMKHYPLPVVVFSGLAGERSDIRAKAMALGALDVVGKPIAGAMDRAIQAITVLIDRVAAAHPTLGVDDSKKPGKRRKGWRPGLEPRLIAIASSTGGPEALAVAIRDIPTRAPPVVIAQHMPGKYLEGMAERLDTLCPARVQMATDNVRLCYGNVYVAPGDQHLVVKRKGDVCYGRLIGGPKVHFQRPSCDVLFKSVAQYVGASAVGIIMTGMGSDGAEGILAMKNAGAYTIGQDEATCTVYGMPREAFRMNALCEVLPLSELVSSAIRLFGLQPANAA